MFCFSFGIFELISAAQAQQRVPWPLGRPLSDVELREQIDDALELDDRERYEELLDAAETGEDSEHIRIFQELIDDVDAVSLDELFDLGDGAFEHDFRSLDGYGDARSTRQQRVHSGVRGGLDNFACLGCHAVGGPDGAGSVSQNAFLEGDGERVSSALIRNPPALLGLGQVQALAAEMSRDLARIRTNAVMEARRRGESIRAELLAKGVDYGALTAHGDGRIETSEIEGIDDDLIVRPFGWKGDEALLRRFIERAARIHFGIQTHPSALAHRETPTPELLGDGKWFDPDGDGVQREMEEGTLTALSLYLILLEAPVILPPRDPVLLESWARGDALFDEVGCNDCHRRTLSLFRSTWEEAPDTTGAPPRLVRLLADGEQPKSSMAVELFSDLKRHAMGEELADTKVSSAGVAPDVFLTRPLWGLAESAPYLHDGRAATVPEAILAHGGDALAARNAFAALTHQDQAALHVFLLSLTRTPKVRIAR